MLINKPFYMYLRVGLIILGAIYLAYVHRDDEARALLFIIAAYEFAYYNLRKEKSEHDYFLAQELYSKNVDELIKNLHLSSH